MLEFPNGRLIVLDGSTSTHLTRGVVDYLVSQPLGLEHLRSCPDVKWKPFHSGAFEVTVPPVRGCDVFIVGSLLLRNDDLLRLAAVIRAARLASASRVTLVCPCLEARSDRKDAPRKAPMASLALEMLIAAGCQGFLTMDMHNQAVQNLGTTIFDNLFGASLFLPKVKQLQKQFPNLVIAFPDSGAQKRDGRYADATGCPTVYIEKKRDPKDNDVKICEVIGDVDGREIVIIDDIVDTADSLILAAEALLKRGATGVHSLITHGVLSNNQNGIPATERIAGSKIRELVVTNTVEPPTSLPPNITVIDVSELFGQAIWRRNTNQSISGLMPFPVD